jgi:hypothetical protein
MNWDVDLANLIGLSYQVIQSKNGQAIPEGTEWKNDAQVISTKIFRHVVSAQQIGAGVALDYGENRKFVHIDHPSVAVIVRAAVEAFLAFNYIFANDDDAISVYRHKLWRRSGLIDRSRHPAYTPESKEIQRIEALGSAKLLSEIQASEFYKAGNREVRRKIDGGEWKPVGGWYAITKDSNIHQEYFNSIYNHLSGHSHASYISILQIRDANDRLEDQKMLADSSRQMLCLILAHFLFSYVKVFPESRNILEQDGHLYKIADTWHIQKKDVTSIYG